MAQFIIFFISNITVLIDFYTTGQIQFPFTKYVSGARVNEIVNKCLNG